MATERASAPPIVRCIRVVEDRDGTRYPCQGWLSGYVYETAEPTAHTLTCSWCAEEYVLFGARLIRVGNYCAPVGGRLVPITRPVGSPAPWPLPDYSQVAHRGPGRPRKERVG